MKRLNIINKLLKVALIALMIGLTLGCRRIPEVMNCDPTPAGTSNFAVQVKASGTPAQRALSMTVSSLYKGFEQGQCTYYAAIEFDKVVAPSPGIDWHGNAAEWRTNAHEKGWVTKTEPKDAIRGAIIVWTGGPGGNGHVAIVRAVTSSSIEIEETNVKVGEVSKATLSFSKLKRASTDPNKPLNFDGYIWPQRQLAVSMANETVAWGSKVSPEFKTKMIAVSGRLGVQPNHLMAAMAVETGGTFDPSVPNQQSGATGLIQFTQIAVDDLNRSFNLDISLDKLRHMTGVEQLDYVEKHLRRQISIYGNLTTLEDVYMAILWPKAISQPNNYPLFDRGSIQYKQNPLDSNNDGQVTKAEASAKVQNSLSQGLQPQNKG